jgi:hypothetical protein
MVVNGYKRTVKRLKIGPPSPEIVEPYEERKAEFQNEQYQNAIDEMEDDVDDEKTVKEIAMEVADGSIAEYVSRHSQNKTPYINQNLIRADYELSQNDAQAVKDLLGRQFTEEQLEEYA